MVTTAVLLGTVVLGAAVAGRCWGRGLGGHGRVKVGFRKPGLVPWLLPETGGGADRKAGFAWLMGRFRDSMKEKKQEMEPMKGGVDARDSAAAARSGGCAEHLVVMVNGIVGSADNWKYAAEQFVKKLPDEVIVHCSQCNYSTLTFDGVDLMGERLSEEDLWCFHPAFNLDSDSPTVHDVLSLVSHRPELRKISFVAHSLGGLVARYAIGRLYGSDPFVKPWNATWRPSTMDKHPDSRMAGLEPMNFITVATPHLGSRGHKQLPFLCGLPFLEQRALQTAHLIVGRTGKHLFLTDNDDGKPPLLLRMVDDCGDLKFRSALRSFRRRVAYANSNFDLMVGWRTSSIRRQHELPNSHLLVSDEKYPHVIYVDRGDIVTKNEEVSSCVEVQTADLEEEMIRGLTQVAWERVDVSFRESAQRYIAHSTIQVRNYWMNSDGADVVSHMIDNFLI